MTQSRTPLRRTLFGALFAASMAFGAVQAFATPVPGGVVIPVSCNPYDRFSAELCSNACGDGYSRGYCGGDGYCRCLS